MARASKHGRQRKKNSHNRYVTRGQRTINKIRRITKFNGPKFLAEWKRVHGVKT